MQIINKIQKKILYLDIFGISPHLYVGNHKTFRTKYGVFSTFFLFFVGIACLYHFGSDIIYRKNPNITIEE